MLSRTVNLAMPQPPFFCLNNVLFVGRTFPQDVPGIVARQRDLVLESQVVSHWPPPVDDRFPTYAAGVGSSFFGPIRFVGQCH